MILSLNLVDQLELLQLHQLLKKITIDVSKVEVIVKEMILKELARLGFIQHNPDSSQHYLADGGNTILLMMIQWILILYA